MNQLTKDRIRTNRSLNTLHPKSSKSGSFNYARVVELRKDLVLQMGYYCAELSQTLMSEFANQIAEGFMNLPINRQLAKTLTRYERNIVEQGLFESGQEIISDMRNLTEA